MMDCIRRSAETQKRLWRWFCLSFCLFSNCSQKKQVNQRGCLTSLSPASLFETSTHHNRTDATESYFFQSAWFDWLCTHAEAPVLVLVHLLHHESITLKAIGATKSNHSDTIYSLEPTEHWDTPKGCLEFSPLCELNTYRHITFTSSSWQRPVCLLISQTRCFGARPLFAVLFSRKDNCRPPTLSRISHFLQLPFFRVVVWVLLTSVLEYQSCKTRGSCVKNASPFLFFKHMIVTRLFAQLSSAQMHTVHSHKSLSYDGMYHFRSINDFWNFYTLFVHYYFVFVIDRCYLFDNKCIVSWCLS